MIERTVTAEGALVADLTPAVYFDASVLIDYWVTDGLERGADLDRAQRGKPHEEVIRELLQTDRRIAVMADIRKALSHGPAGAHAVTSPLALLEVIEWYAGSAIKGLTAGAAGGEAIQRMGRKNVGNLLNRILDGRRLVEAEEVPDSGERPTGIEILRRETSIAPGFAQAHGLAGIVIADIAGFSFSKDEAWDVSEIFAYLQMGMADIVHLLVARHFGCTWIASFDSDFARCREYIKMGLGLTLLATADEMCSVLVPYPEGTRR